MQIKYQVRLKCPWISEMYHSSFNSKARGVAALMRKLIQFSASSDISDKNGKYLIIPGHLFHIPIMFIYICVTNFDD